MQSFFQNFKYLYKRELLLAKLAKTSHSSDIQSLFYPNHLFHLGHIDSGTNKRLFNNHFKLVIDSFTGFDINALIWKSVLKIEIGLFLCDLFSGFVCSILQQSCKQR